MWVRIVPFLALSMVLAGCAFNGGEPDPTGQPNPSTGQPPLPTGAIEPPAANYSLLLEGMQLTQVVPLPNGDLLLAERKGILHVLPAGSRTPVMVLNISDRVTVEAERGFSSLALHPDFETNGMVFVAYTKSTGPKSQDPEEHLGFSELTRYHVDPKNVRAPWERVDVLMRLDWERYFHNTADLKFGPDGMLYFGLADGSKDRMEAQNLRSLNGSILRLDVDDAPGYKIPADNPFVDQAGARPEIFLYGLRNPWRMDFHPTTGDLYIAASGESKVESVYVFPADGSAPRNQGWPYYEGNQRFEEYEEPTFEVNMPIAAYERPEGSGLCAIVGGAIYHGDLFPTLRGQFVFADHCLGQLMFTQKVGTEWHVTYWHQLKGQYINSVDSDADGELVVSTLFGRVYTITAP